MKCWSRIEHLLESRGRSSRSSCVPVMNVSTCLCVCSCSCGGQRKNSLKSSWALTSLNCESQMAATKISSPPASSLNCATWLSACSRYPWIASDLLLDRSRYDKPLWTLEGLAKKNPRNCKASSAYQDVRVFLCSFDVASLMKGSSAIASKLAKYDFISKSPMLRHNRSGSIM